MRLTFWLVPVVGVSLGCKSPELVRKDMMRDARLGCERGDAPSCFHAGALSVEEPGGANRAVSFFAKGCAKKHAASCDALAETKGPSRGKALADGCNAGDLVTCTRLADDYPADPAGLEQAKSLREQVCRMGAAIRKETSARDLKGAAEACAKLASMFAKGQGTKTNSVVALKLDILATTLGTEALYRLEREPAASEGAGTATEREKDRARRETDANVKAREAFLAASQAELKARGPTAGGSSVIASPLTPAERAFLRVASCRTCSESCGTPARCSADDFTGGPCSHLRCAASGPCPAFDGCVSDCARKVDACAKACGTCQKEGK